jgi:hypothetical protein
MGRLLLLLLLLSLVLRLGLLKPSAMRGRGTKGALLLAGLLLLLLE